MKKIIKRGLIGLSIVLAASVTYVAAAGEGPTKRLEAWFPDIKISVNGSPVAADGDKQPFIIGGTTFVPLRLLAEIVGMEVLWDEGTTSIEVNGERSEAGELRKQLTDTENEVLELQKRIAELEAEAKTYKERFKSELEDLEDYLDAKYARFKTIIFRLSLTGDNEYIGLQLSVDMETYGRELGELTLEELQSYIEAICEDIRDEIPGASIGGQLYDRSSKSRLLSFTVGSGGRVSLRAPADLPRLERALNTEYQDSFEDIPIYISLNELANKATFTVELDYRQFKVSWDDLRTTDIKIALLNICSELMSEFGDYNIEGSVEDKSGSPVLAHIYVTYEGDVTFTRYEE